MMKHIGKKTKQSKYYHWLMIQTNNSDGISQIRFMKLTRCMPGQVKKERMPCRPVLTLNDRNCFFCFSLSGIALYHLKVIVE